MINYTLTGGSYKDLLLGGLTGAAILTIIMIAVLFIVAVYIYFALAWYTIAKKRKHRKPWLAWIPVANIALWLQLGGFHWAWIFLVLAFIPGWIALFVLFIISNWRVFEKLKYPGWLSLSPLLDLIGPGIGTVAYGIVVGIIAWGKK